MKSEVLYYFDLAAKEARRGMLRSDNGKTFFLYSIGLRNDQVIVGASNIISDFPTPKAHAEVRTANMLDYNAKLFTVRVRSDMSLAIARPCKTCQKILRYRKVDKAFYSISDYEFGVWSPNRPEKHYHIERKIYSI